MVALTSSEVDANWLVLANLGPFENKTRLPAIIEEQARRISELALRHDFGRIALVTFAANVLGNVEEIADRMLAGFASLPDKTQLQWFEGNEGRFNALQKHLGTRAEVALSHKRALDLNTVNSAPASEELYAIVRRSDNQLRCALLLPSGAAACHEHTSELKNEELDALNQASRDGAPSLAESEAMGRKVAHLLFGDTGTRQIEQHAPTRRLIIQHDLQSSAIPFETLRAGAVVPAVSQGLVRRISFRAEQLSTPVARPPTAGKLKLLLVVDPRGDLPHARREADDVCRLLGEVEEIEILPALAGALATTSAVKSALTNTSVDVLHYCGHAEFEKAGVDDSGLVCHDASLTARDLQNESIGPRIVFFNACQSARVRNRKATTQEVAQAFAQAVLGSGVDAYLGTFWPVADDAAALFAATVYLELAGGAELHRAVATARKKLLEDEKSDWANYLLFGSGAFKLKMG